MFRISLQGYDCHEETKGTKDHTIAPWSAATSVADPGWLSRVLIFTHPDPRSKNSNKREG
jgi:hypothetical protein